MHVSKNEDQYQRAVQNVEIDNIQTIFESVLAQIQPRLQEGALHCLSEQVDWAGSPERQRSLLDQQTSER